VVQDVGLAINPRAVRSQIQGGVAQGIGYALHEEITIGDHGGMEQPGFEQYLLPLAQDVLAIEIALHEGAPSIGPMGAKGAGEIPIMNVGATVACAVTRAIGSGVAELPLTPPRVLDLMNSGGRKLDLPYIVLGWPGGSSS
jgi:CO/xanthine dehydrogenase Mo-binding subunit